MNRVIYKKNNHNLHQSFSKIRPYGNVLSTLNKIFETYGKNNILHLVKLRKLWFSEIDSFLSKNAYPRNISVNFEFIVNPTFLNELEKTNLTPDLSHTLQKMNERSFSRLEQFILYLEKELGRPITNEEMKLLKNKVQFKPIQNILHLTVYDGSISHAINIETEAYIRIFNKLLPEIKFDDIHCHVGEIEKIQLDQQYVASLAKYWHLITPDKVHRKCMPAFLHRVSKKNLVLILYVSNMQDLDILKNNPGVDWLLEHLKKEFSELREVLKNIKFVHVEEVDLEKIRLTSLILGGTSKGRTLTIGAKKSVLPSQFSKKLFFAKKGFSKICKKLKS